jgi:MtN3 and saliva related transmembrane protein
MRALAAGRRQPNRAAAAPNDDCDDQRLRSPRRGAVPGAMSLVADGVGALAAALTTIAFIPQAWHTWRTRSTQGISLGMYSIFTAGVAAWLVYGILIGAWPIIVANAITLALALFILAMKLRHG